MQLNKLLPLLAFSVLLLIPTGAQNAFAGPFASCTVQPTNGMLTIEQGESDNIEISCTIFPFLFVPIDAEIVLLPSDCQANGIDLASISGVLVNGGGGDTSVFDVMVTNNGVAAGDEAHCTLSYEWVQLQPAPGPILAMDQDIWVKAPSVPAHEHEIMVGDGVLGPGISHTDGNPPELMECPDGTVMTGMQYQRDGDQTNIQPLCSGLTLVDFMMALVGGGLLTIDSVSLLVGAIGTNPIFTALVGISLAGVAAQAVWFVHRRKNKN